MLTARDSADGVILTWWSRGEDDRWHTERQETLTDGELGAALAVARSDGQTTDSDLFESRLNRTETCSRCRGQGTVRVVEYAICQSRDPIEGAPEGAVLASMVGCSGVFAAGREAAEIARRTGRPVAFQCLDHVVVVRPGDDPDEIVHAWWLRQYGETPEDTLARR